MKTDIITLGSATIDTFLRCESLKTKKIESNFYLELNEKNNVESMEIHTGGGATNSAATFANLKFNVKPICSIGDDKYGHIIRRDMLSRNIKTNLFQVSKSDKTAFSAILSTGKSNRAVFIFRGASRKINHREIDWKNLKGHLIYISSLGGNMKLLTKAIMTAHQNGLKIAFNPGNQEIKHGLENMTDLLCYVDYLILNSSEAESLSGGTLFAEMKMFKKLKSCVKGLVIITYGAKGAKIFDGDEVLYRKALGEEKIDSTGAGDAFGSGFTGMMLKTDGDIDRSFEFALRNSGNVITKLGAKNGLIKR